MSSNKFTSAYNVGDWCLRGYIEELQTDARSRGDTQLTRLNWDELHTRHRAEALRRFEENSKHFQTTLVTKAKENLDSRIESELECIVEIYENNQLAEAMVAMLEQSKQSNRDMSSKVASLEGHDEQLNAELYANQQRLQHLNESCQTAQAQPDMSVVDSMRAELELHEQERNFEYTKKRATEDELQHTNDRIDRLTQHLDWENNIFRKLLSCFCPCWRYRQNYEPDDDDYYRDSNTLS